MDISSTKHYQAHLKCCEKSTGKKGVFVYGRDYELLISESIVKEAAQDVYNRLTGHGLSYGAISYVIDIVQTQLRHERDSKEL